MPRGSGVYQMKLAIMQKKESGGIPFNAQPTKSDTD